MPSLWAGGGRSRKLLHLLLCGVFFIYNERIGGIPRLLRVQALESFYANVTLKANNGDLSAVIYLPKDLKPGGRTYYQSSRFDWSSMIGSIKRKTTNPITEEKESHVLYGTQQWRLPHDPYWTESGVGLASEFGVGTDGSLCNFMCGWDKESEVTNGILGYQEAKSGESFLKIGVGELIKGSCSTCDSTEDYKFNSPYMFARPPVWDLEYDTDDDKTNSNINSINLSHSAVLGDGKPGYKLEKQITLNDDQLLVKNTLTNLGSEAFSTAWYSHHIFSCDAHPVQYKFSVELDLASTRGEYSEPWTWSWSTPLGDYATVYNVANDDYYDDSNGDEDTNGQCVRIDMQRGVESNAKIRAEFIKNDRSKGKFTLRACNTKIKETIPEVGDGISGISMYAYNLYVESGTFSPEPQILLRLNPGESTSWTQQLDFSDDYPEAPQSSSSNAMVGSLLLQQSVTKTESTSASSSSNTKHRHKKSSGSINTNRQRDNIAAITAFALIIAMALVAQHRSRRTKAKHYHNDRSQYLPIPDADLISCDIDERDKDQHKHDNNDDI